MVILKAINHFVGLLGYFLLGIILSGEAARYFFGHPNIWLPYGAEYILTAFLLGFWFLLIILLLEIGFRFQNQVLAFVAVCGIALSVTAMICIGFHQRIEFQEAFNNPFTVVLIACSLLLLYLGWKSHFVPFYQKELGVFAVIGIFSLLAVLTIEWTYSLLPLTGDEPTWRSITLPWTLYALLWIFSGFSLRGNGMPVRVCGLIILFAATVKSALFDSAFSFGYYSWSWNVEQFEQWIPLFNPYFLMMLIPVIPAMFLASWTSMNRHAFIGNSERATWKAAGIGAIVTLLIYLSVECYHYFDTFEKFHYRGEELIVGSASLTLLWTLIALVLSVLALAYRSPILRILSMTLLGFSVFKVLLFDVAFRPDFKNMLPLLNPFCFPMLFLGVAIIILGYLWSCRLKESETAERNAYRVFAFFGVFFLWLALSVECFQTVSQEAWKAQMALSILWSVFAGVLIIIGFLRQSVILRWMAIILFAVTLLKVLAVDMSGVNELYRFGAVFVLATLLALAAWAYQRFKPEQ